MIWRSFLQSFTPKDQRRPLHTLTAQRMRCNNKFEMWGTTLYQLINNNNCVCSNMKLFPNAGKRVVLF
jgi:hypothetical protein